MKAACWVFVVLALVGGFAGWSQTPRPAPPAGTGSGGTCAGLGGDVTGTCAANTIKASVGLTGAPTTPTGTSGDGSTQIANDSFVATALASINPAVSVQAATVAVLSNTPTYSNGTAGVGATLTAGSNGALTIDGYAVLLSDRILVKNQVSALQNGVYTETTLGTGGVPYVLTRATDYNSVSNINYTGTIPVIQGSTLLNTGWNLTTQVATLGTDALSYTQAAAGNAGGPPGGNVKATGNMPTGDVITGAGGKTIQDSGVTLTSITPTTNQKIRTIGAHFDGGGSAISGTKTSCMRTPYAGTITGWYIDADVSGSATFAVRSVAFGSYTGTAGFAGYTDVTGGGTAPVLSSAVTATFANLTSWVTTVTVGNEFCFQMTSPTTVTAINVYLTMAAN